MEPGRELDEAVARALGYKSPEHEETKQAELAHP